MRAAGWWLASGALMRIQQDRSLESFAERISSIEALLKQLVGASQVGKSQSAEEGTRSSSDPVNTSPVAKIRRQAAKLDFAVGSYDSMRSAIADRGQEIPRVHKGLQAVLGERSVREFLSKSSPIAVEAPDGEAFSFPPQEFIEWVEEFEQTSFDEHGSAKVTNEPSSFLPGFVVAQMQRHWVTLCHVLKNLPEDGALVDLGSFPFGIPFALRSFTGFKGRIVATVIQPLDARSQGILDRYGIEAHGVNLDPHVVDETTAGFECRIPMPDASADVVLLAHVIEHLYHPMDILREVHRVLRPNGVAIVTTDNGLSVNTLSNLFTGTPFLQEPVEGTAAMVIHAWRGHVRFFSASDVETMLKASGFGQVHTSFDHIFYNVFSSKFFQKTKPMLSEWKLEILREYPQYSNDMAILARKT